MQHCWRTTVHQSGDSGDWTARYAKQSAIEKLAPARYRTCEVKKRIVARHTVPHGLIASLPDGLIGVCVAVVGVVREYGQIVS